jgi:alkanesulfonate monooxygenase SsuD/methylene tetrahydromethanopterin reductase-like flavin-dependent oxidoreductase (luciferase family)
LPSGSIYGPSGHLDIGLVLPSKGAGTGPEALDAAATVAAELGWRSVWVTDHLMVPPGDEAEEYGCILEALIALTYVAARHEHLSVGTSVVVPAMRDAPILAKQLATLDLLCNGRLEVGVGASDGRDIGEYSNLGKQERFSSRGAYLDEAVALWRHLWAGETCPFEGEFHRLEDFTFAPLPPQRQHIPIHCGGRSERALRRVVQLADGYHAAQTGPKDLEVKLPVIAAGCAEAGRPLPRVSVRARVRFDQPRGDRYILCGSDSDIADELVAFAIAGTEEIVAVFDAVRPAELEAAARRFHEGAVLPARTRIEEFAGSH